MVDVQAASFPGLPAVDDLQITRVHMGVLRKLTAVDKLARPVAAAHQRQAGIDDAGEGRAVWHG